MHSRETIGNPRLGLAFEDVAVVPRIGLGETLSVDGNDAHWKLVGFEIATPVLRFDLTMQATTKLPLFEPKNLAAQRSVRQTLGNLTAAPDLTTQFRAQRFDGTQRLAPSNEPKRERRDQTSVRVSFSFGFPAITQQFESGIVNAPSEALERNRLTILLRHKLSC